MNEPIKRTRQRLTLTMMYKAINEISRALKSQEERDVIMNYMIGHQLHSNEKGEPAYFTSLLEVSVEGGHPRCVMVAESVEGIEEATALLLEKVKAQFEQKKRALVESLDSILERHHGALKGARSKIREKKT